jgi:L-lysine 2,3-aminomutase
MADSYERYHAVNRFNVHKIPQWDRLDADLRDAIDVVSRVLPFRTNRYVTDELIDWSRVPDDPMFQLTFSQKGMLSPENYATVARLIHTDAPPEVIASQVDRIRARLNPQPAGQKTHNVPSPNGERLEGIQHKYRETVLFFSKRGQTCHAYCTYCFRWAQFVGVKDVRFAASGPEQLVAYLNRHPAVSDVLITGGDPMMLRAPVLARFVEPLLAIEHLRSIRIGTKAPATWPHRFLTDPDADGVLSLFESVVDAGKNLAVMGHYTHPVELSTDLARRAVDRIISTGANIRMQTPVVRHINDDSGSWIRLWKEGVRLGCIPYYMFVTRDTGSRGYFELPLIRCWEIFQNAYRRVSGLARTVRGPSMSTHPGKVCVLGPSQIGDQKVLALTYLQARDPKLVGIPFFARYDADATWFDQLEPATPHDEEFFRHRAAAPLPWPERQRADHLLRVSETRSSS